MNFTNPGTKEKNSQSIRYKSKNGDHTRGITPTSWALRWKERYSHAKKTFGTWAEIGQRREIGLCLEHLKANTAVRFNRRRGFLRTHEEQIGFGDLSWNEQIVVIWIEPRCIPSWGDT